MTISFIGNISQSFSILSENASGTHHQQLSELTAETKPSFCKNFQRDTAPSLVFALNIIFGFGFVITCAIGLGLASTPIGCGSLIFLGLLGLGLWYFNYYRKPNLNEEAVRTLIKSHLVTAKTPKQLTKIMAADRITFNDIYQHNLLNKSGASSQTQYARLIRATKLFQAINTEKKALKKKVERTYSYVILPASITRPRSIQLYHTEDLKLIKTMPISQAEEIRARDLERIKSLYRDEIAKINTLYQSHSH